MGGNLMKREKEKLKSKKVLKHDHFSISMF